MKSVSDVLESMEVEGNSVKMPQLDRKLYLQVIKQLEALGGRWDKKAKAIIFNTLSGETLKKALLEIGDAKDLRKEYQFFETPKELAQKIVSCAQIKPFHRVLEPSAGCGAIIEAVLEKHPSFNSGPISNLEAVEIWETKCMVLSEKFGKKIKKITNADFLNFSGRYDRIIANPPFCKNQDIQHVQKMYELLSLGGRLVSLTSTHWTFAKEKKCEDFREWLIDVDANVYDVAPNTFEDTSIATKLIIIDKELYQQ